MRLLTWNTNFRSAECLAGITASHPDVVLLQEVKHRQAADFVAALRGFGCSYAAYSGSPAASDKRYGNITASRWPVSMISGWAPGMPWPQLALRATVHAPEGDLDTVNIHIPNGSANGWRKVESLESLARALESAGDSPRALAGDFNEPQDILSDGTIVSFGESMDEHGFVHLGRRGSAGRRFTDRFGHEDDLQRWADAVRRIFDSSAKHGLHHILDLRSGGPFPATHIVKGGDPRFFDHLFLSSHLTATQHVYVDAVREGLKHSDHSALYADVVLTKKSA